MSIYLTAAMQLFGRTQDTLSHVLVNEDFEGNPAFYYPPPEPITLKTRDGREVSTRDARIYLAPIPFIRLRGVRSDWLRDQSSENYGSIVRRAQEILDYIESEHDLSINLQRQRVTIGQGQRTISLTKRELFFYAMFADFRLEGRNGDGTVGLDSLRREDFDKTFRQITAASGDEAGIEECESIGGFGFLKEMMDQSLSPKMIDRDHFKSKFYTMNSRIKSKFKAKGLPEQFALTLQEASGEACYQLSILPEKIRFA